MVRVNTKLCRAEQQTAWHHRRSIAEAMHSIKAKTPMYVHGEGSGRT